MKVDMDWTSKTDNQGRAVALATLMGLVVSLLPVHIPVEAADAVADVREIAAARPSEAVQEITLASLGYSDQTLRGIYPTADFWFPGPGDVETLSGNYVRLVLSHSEILLADRSTLSVTFNGVPVANYRLVPQTAKRLVVQADVPARLIRPDANLVRLSFYMRIIDEGCRDADSPALSALVSNESAVHYEVGASTAPEKVLPDLAKFPHPWFRPNDPFTSWVNYVAPVSPSAADLTAMASISAKVGQLAGGKALTTTVSASDKIPASLKAKDNLIAVGTPDNNALIRELGPLLPLRPSGSGFANPDGTAIPADQGVIQSIASPFAPGKSILVVSGGNQEGVRRSGQVLATNTLRKVLVGQYAVVTDRPQPPVAAVPRDNGRVFSLADIGYDEQTAYGSGQHTINVSFESPPLDDKSGGYIDLAFSHSLPLIADLSSLSVSLNNVPIASVGLRESNANRAVFRANIPPTTLQSGPNALQLTFSLRVEKEDCAILAEKAQWGVIHRDTEIHLPKSPTGSSQTLQNFPYPFVKEGSTNGTVIALSNSPKPDELQVAMAFAADLGRRTSSDVTWLEAVPADSVNDVQRRGKNLVAFGLPAGNALFNQVNDSLPLQFDGSTFVLKQANQTLLTVRGQAPLGVVEEISSPWVDQGGDRTTILVISATTVEGLNWARVALYGKLGGNVATVARDGRVTVLDLTVPKSNSLPIQAPRQILPFAVTGVAGLLIVCLILVMFLQTLRDRRRNDAAEYNSTPPAA